MRYVKVLLIGGGAREHAIGEALCRDERVELCVVSSTPNPGLARLATVTQERSERDADWIAAWAQKQHIDLALIGLEDPLDAGVPDALWRAGIPTVGPVAAAARLETSKLFTRELVQRHRLPGAVEHHHFTDPGELEAFLRSSDREWALKPVGLTAGKGVRVMGEQLGGVDEAIDYGRQVIGNRIGGDAGIVLEERLVGEEFTLQAFVDGKTLVPMPLVQDYKRAFEGDLGPNTGSMGSYSREDHMLPFLGERDRDEALRLMRGIVDALRAEEITYQGIMYGQFMMTGQGVRLVEINARFGDPEAANVLPLLETSLLDICVAIAERRLHEVDVRFAHRATVCKYIAPFNYPDAPLAGAPLRLDEAAIQRLGVRTYFARVVERDGAFLTSTSRAMALVGVADTIWEAEERVEQALRHVEGTYHVRHDIGKKHLVERSLRAPALAGAPAA